MPCVLPVLAIKLASIVESGLPVPQFVGFFGSAAGIVVSFLLLASRLTVVRLAGGRWAGIIQFQSPLFLAGMMLVVGLFMLILLDRLILPVPAFVQRLSAVQQTALNGQSAAILWLMLATLLQPPVRRCWQCGDSCTNWQHNRIICDFSGHGLGLASMGAGGHGAWPSGKTTAAWTVDGLLKQCSAHC